jgi:hypothetical protein
MADSTNLLGEPDEEPFWPANIAKPVGVFILDDFAHELGAARPEPHERVVEVIHGEHDAEVTERIHRGVPVILDDLGTEKTGKLEPAMAVGRAQHGDFDALIPESGDASGPFSFDHGPPFERQPEFLKEANRRSEVLDDDANVVHAFEPHRSTVAGRRPIRNRPVGRPARPWCAVPRARKVRPSPAPRRLPQRKLTATCAAIKELITDAAARAIRYLEHLGSRSVAPTAEAVAALQTFNEPLPDEPLDPAQT